MIHHLTPDKLADGKRTVCPNSTQGCRDSCLNTSGRSQVTGPLSTKLLKTYYIHTYRINKTLDYLSDRQGYADRLVKELQNLTRRAKKKKRKPVARLNGTSDIPWEKYIDMSNHPAVQFYDYTKSFNRMKKFLAGNFPKNYDLTYSYSEKTTPAEINWVITQGGNVAVVFKDKLPKKFMGFTVIDGDKHDFRFRDKKGMIVGLKAKGRAKKDTTGFVV